MKRKDAKCRLYRANCLEQMAAIADRSVHAVLTDHPYGSTDCAWDQRVNLAAWWEQVERITTETAIIASFAAQPFATDLINSCRKWFRYELVWDKRAPVGYLNANRQPLRVHELLIVFCRRPGTSIYNPQLTAGKPYIMRAPASTSIYSHCDRVDVVNTGTRHPTSILRFAKPMRHRRHPTEKPIALCEWMVLSYSRPGCTILDCFMGTAPIGEASLMHGRRFIGIERDESIFATAVDRLLPHLDARSKSLIDPRFRRKR